MQVGTDANAQLVRNALSDCGVDISHLREVEGPTGSAIISVDPEGELSCALLIQAAVDGAQHQAFGKAWQWAGSAVIVVALGARQMWGKSQMPKYQGGLASAPVHPHGGSSRVGTSVL